MAGMVDFLIREWRLEPYEGDQAPLHIHHAGEEASVCISGDLEVLLGMTRQQVVPGDFILVTRGTVHTFAARAGAHVLAVMSPEIADLIDGLHTPASDAERAALWARCRSSLV
jgi:quercetin dioxygenase-like cupin family protein